MPAPVPVRCEDCRFWQQSTRYLDPTLNRAVVPEGAPESRLVPLGMCHRWPGSATTTETQCGHWCGEYQKR